MIQVQFTSQADRLISSSVDRTVLLWSVATKECPLVFTGRNNTCEFVYSPLHEQVAISCQDNSIYLWDTSSGTQLTLQGQVMVAHVWARSKVYSGPKNRIAQPHNVWSHEHGKFCSPEQLFSFFFLLSSFFPLPPSILLPFHLP